MIALSYFASEKDNQPQPISMSWEQLSELLGRARVAPCTAGPGAAACAGKNCPHKAGPSWSPATYSGTRSTKNVTSVSLLSLDLDHFTEAQLVEADAKLRPYRYIAHSTHNDRPGDRALRVVIPLSRPVTRDEYPRFWHGAVGLIDVTADRVVKDAGRLFYLPSHPSDCPFTFSVNDGAPIDVDAVLAMAPPSTAVAPAATPTPGPRKKYPPASPELLAHAWQRLEHHGPSIRGEGGDAHAFQVGAILLNDLGLSFEEAWPLAKRWNTLPGNAWSDDRLATKLQNGASYAKGEPGAERDEFEANLGFKAVVAEHVAAVAPAPGSWSALLAQARVDVAAALNNTAFDGGEAEPLFESAGGLFTCTYPPTPWLVKGLIVEGGVTIVGGIPKRAFKSWALVEIAVAIATGTRAFGDFETGTPKRVAYFFCEDQKRAVRNRVRAVAAARNMTPEQVTANLFVQPRGRFLDLLKDEDLALIVASCRMIGDVGVLILDPLRDIHSGEEDKSDAMISVMKRLKLLGVLLNCTPMVAHHSGKGGEGTKGRGGGQSLRGSGSIHGSVDNGFYLSSSTGDGSTHFRNTVESEVKSARSAGVFDLSLVITDDGDGEAIKAMWSVEKTTAKGAASAIADEEKVCAIAAQLKIAFNGQLTSTAIRDKVKGGKDAVDAALRRMEVDGLIAQVYQGRRPAGWALTERGRQLADTPIVVAGGAS